MIRQIEISNLLDKPRTYIQHRNVEGESLYVRIDGPMIYVIETKEKLKNGENISFYDEHNIKHELYHIKEFKLNEKASPDIKVVECTNYAQDFIDKIIM